MKKLLHVNIEYCVLSLARKYCLHRVT